MTAHVLFLDDETYRHDSFKRLYWQTDCEMWQCYNYDDFIETINKKKDGWDVFFMDHDLGMESRDGTDAVRYMIEKQIRPTNVVVHSWNPNAAKRMRLLLDEAWITNFYIPFGYEYPKEIIAYFHGNNKNNNR